MIFLRQLQTWSSWLNAQIYLDIGSSMTRIVYQQKLVWQQPTCLAIENQSGTVISVGDKAFSLLGKVPGSVNVVFPVKNGQVSHLDQMQKYIESIIATLKPQLGLPFFMNMKAHVALPASSSPVEAQNWTRVLKMAGFQNAALWLKPEALYLSAIKAKIPADYLCVIDLGADTTEIAVFTQGEVFKAETLLFGSHLFTKELELQVREKHQGIGSWSQMEKIKRGLSGISMVPSRKNSNHKTSMRVTDIVSRNPKAIYIERATIEQSFEEVAQELLLLVQGFLGQLPSDIATALLERGIYLTGGGSHLVGLSEFLSHHLKLVYSESTQPDLDLIWGLAELGAASSQQRVSLK